MNGSRVRLCLLMLMLTMPLAAARSEEPGAVIDLTLDATEVPNRILRTTEVMAVKPGALTLYYPKWIPGEHEPSGPVGNIAELKFTASGKTIPWRRDLLDAWTFHLNVPEGASRLEISFDYLEPSGGPFSGGASATDKLVVVSWNDDVLYPAGIRAQQIFYHPTLKLPDGWKFGTPLPVESQSENQVTFKPVELNRLVDSPVVAGEYFRNVDITPEGEPIHHEIDIIADSEEALAVSPEVQKDMKNLVAESGKLFGARHYRDYHFLLTLSDHVAHFGLEHHESNDSRTEENILLSPMGRRGLGGLLSHEFMHSWNGKFRRPADLSAPYYEEPMKDDLLWVYEGLTDFLGPLLATRSGLWTAEEYKDHFAGTAASLGPGRPGRTWRPLQDTADAIPGMFRFGGWGSWTRGADYYPEGDLLWLEVSMIIHDESHGAKSIEDFCRAFYGGPNSGPELKTYTFDDLVKVLNAVQPYDWAGFFHERLNSTSSEAPVGGIERGGWKVEYTDQPPRGEGRGGGGGRFGGGANATYSLGLAMGGDGTVFDSIRDSVAFKAGVMPGMKVVAINDRAFTPDLLRQQLKASKDHPVTMRLLVLYDDYYKTATLSYQGGEKFPHLVQVEGKPDTLDELSKPLVK